jgi:Protein of unknown function (DUF3102)
VTLGAPPCEVDGRTMSSSNPVARIRASELAKLVAELEPEAAAIKAALATEEQGLTTALTAALEVGERLSRARARAPHGLWLPYLKVTFQWTDATARRYMKLYELSKSYNLSNLKIPRSALYLLAAASTPEKTRDDILKRAEAGERFLFDDIEATIAKGRIAALGRYENAGPLFPATPDTSVGGDDDSSNPPEPQSPGVEWDFGVQPAISLEPEAELSEKNVLEELRRAPKTVRDMVFALEQPTFAEVRKIIAARKPDDDARPVVTLEGDGCPPPLPSKDMFAAWAAVCAEHIDKMLARDWPAELLEKFAAQGWAEMRTEPHQLRMALIDSALAKLIDRAERWRSRVDVNLRAAKWGRRLDPTPPPQPPLTDKSGEETNVIPLPPRA